MNRNVRIAAAFLLVAAAVLAAAEDKFQQKLKKTFEDHKPQDVKRELLWPNGAPGAKGEADHDKPTIDAYLPPSDKATGAAVIVLPGGGYGGLAIGHEGMEVGEFLRDHGIAGFVVRYRLGAADKGGYRHPVMLHDAQRGIRYVRHNAEKLGVDPQRVGLMGFSAGGHLASTAGTHFDAGDASAADPIDRASSRPDFLILCYPVVSFAPPYTHGGSVKNLLGDNPDPAVIENLSNDKQVTKDTPPTFLFHTDEDPHVPAENSVLFYLALRKAKVPAELHIYRLGRHGIGLGKDFPHLQHWPDLLVNWMDGLGLLERAKQ